MVAPVDSPRSDQARWFAEHVQPHESMLRAWLHARFAGRVDVDDLVQEAFLRVLRARDTGELRSPKAFLFATARNLALDRLRRHEVIHTESLGEIEALDVLDEGTAIPEAVARQQELELLTAAIQSLPDRCRQVFTLRKLYGLSQREIARRLGISESTVENQITIGVQKCTAYFAAHGAGKDSP
ncbi:MAG: RNA polymerase sigma factor [Verrucomicrobia bacterium]|nr:RNA polymerase sigma factor [Verrucomicrobiota bacterium]